MENEPANESSPPAPSQTPASPPAVSRTERRVRAAADALRTLLRDLHLDRHGAELPAHPVELTLRLRVDPSKQWDLVFEPPFVDQVDEQIAEAKALRDVYLKGAVYCFRCGSSVCEHASPPAPNSVFHGYDEIGRPGWGEFHQVLLEMKNERVDQLYAMPPAVLTCVQFGRQLRGRQMASFGRSSRTYAILGQVIAGYFPMPRMIDAVASPPEKLAITFQVVEARDADGSLRLHFNVLAKLPGTTSLDVLFGNGWQPDVFRARAIASRSLAALEHRVRGARHGGRHDEARDLLRQIPSLLHRLAEGLDRGHRQTQRRTQHAEQRRQESRPVHKAMEDARDAKRENFFFDLKSEAFIVCGPKGRTHAFNAAGKHVTSFLIKPDTVDFRLRTQRWRMGEEAEFSAFIEKLRPDGSEG
jgi:hypothetical protein